MSRLNVETARVAYEAINRGDIDAALEVVHPEIEWHMSHRFGPGLVFHGHDGVREVLALFDKTLDGFQVEAKEFLDAGDKVMVRVCITGRERTSGEVAHDLVQVWSGQGGKAIRLDVFDTRAEALASLRSG